MAIFGSLGSVLGLGTAQETVQTITGSPIAGRAAGVVSRGISRLGTEQGQSTAVAVAPTPARETAMSGEQGMARPASAAAGAGYSQFIQPATYVPPAPGGAVQRAALPAIIGGGTAIARGSGGLAGMLGLAGGALAIAPIIIDPITGEEKKLRVTRKLRSQVKNAVMLVGIEQTAELMGTDVEVVVYILTKKMRNDGPYVTKAAVRKTRQTVRKMKSLCDMYDDLRPAAKRRAPARRSSATTLIKN
jgi:hypothetical protein